MLYMKCPTCKQLLGDKQLIYEKLNNHIQQEYMLGNINEQEYNKAKQEIIQKLNLDRYCCNMRLLTYLNDILLVK